VLIVAAVTLRLPLLPGGTATNSPGDLLARVRAAGSVRIAVTNGPPQTAAAGGAYIGFDVDVAQAIASALGVRPIVTAMPAAEILAGAGQWDLGFPSRTVTAIADLAPTSAYYGWPVWLAVAPAFKGDDLSALEGRLVCVVSGTAGTDWVAGRTSPRLGVTLPAPAVLSIERASDSACLAAVLAGEADAAVTAALLDDELADRGVRTLGREPVLVERRSVLVRGGADAATMIDAVDRAIADLRASGRLADLSRGAFGGRDLSGVD
jgi:ABC-type amino acid transport substrate-binding protein